MIFKERILSQGKKKFKADIDNNTWFLLKLELVLSKPPSFKRTKKSDKP